MISLYRPGFSILHRLAAGTKLAALAVVSTALALYPHDAVSAAVTLLLVLLGYVAAGFRVADFLRGIWQLRFLVVVLAAFLAVFVSPLVAWINTTRVVSLLLLAGLLTMTTKTADLLDVLHRLLTPLRRVGVNADAVSLTLLMTITMVPLIAGFADRLREAERARGVRLGVRMLVPLFVMSLRHADDVGDALAARSLS